MNFVLLDVVSGSELIAGGVVLFMVGCVLTEAVVLRLMKCPPTFGKAFLYSLIANVITMLIGFLIVPKLENGLLSNYDEIPRIAFYFAASFVVEFLVLLMLIKNVNWMRILLTSFAMNLVSYGLLIALFIEK
jgi:hypothetical protein